MISVKQPDVMKQQTNIFFAAGTLGALVWFAAGPSVAAGTDAKPLVVQARTVTAPAPAAVLDAEIPQSTFVIPKKLTEGKDPFFPSSSRVYMASSPVSSNGAPTIVADLMLKGISGSAQRPLAIINTTTFAVGEVNEVIFKTGRLTVQCLEINMETGTVLLQVGGERRRLFLGK